MSQEQQVLNALKKGRKITPMDAIMEWNCYRLGGRIYDLREQGWNIKTDMVKSSSGKRFAMYSLGRPHRK
jgi:hypothetical protein